MGGEFFPRGKLRLPDTETRFGAKLEHQDWSVGPDSFLGQEQLQGAIIFVAPEIKLILSLCVGRTHYTSVRTLLMLCLVLCMALYVYFFHIDCLQ